MRALSFDTSTPSIQLCLLESGRVVFEHVRRPEGAARQEAVTMLVPCIDFALKEAGWNKNDLALLVVGQGPGSFTGIRAGVSTARTLAQALDLPLVGVSVLECLARQGGLPAAVLLAGAEDRFFVGAFGAEGDVILEPSYLDTDEMRRRLPEPVTWFADEAAGERLGRLSLAWEPLPELKNIAVMQAQIAWDRVSLRVPVPPDLPWLKEQFPWREVQPLYLRGPSVTVKKVHGHQNKAHDAG